MVHSYLLVMQGRPQDRVSMGSQAQHQALAQALAQAQTLAHALGLAKALAWPQHWPRPLRPQLGQPAGAWGLHRR